MTVPPATESPVRARILSRLAQALLVFLLVIVIFGWRERQRGVAHLERSDSAFHQNDLLTALREARAAGLAYVPGSGHVRAAEERLEAIARGAEAEGRFDLARRAWDALRVVTEATEYPGRAASPAGQRAREALKRLDAWE